MSRRRPTQLPRAISMPAHPPIDGLAPSMLVQLVDLTCLKRDRHGALKNRTWRRWSRPRTWSTRSYWLRRSAHELTSGAPSLVALAMDSSHSRNPTRSVWAACSIVRRVRPSRRTGELPITRRHTQVGLRYGRKGRCTWLMAIGRQRQRSAGSTCLRLVLDRRASRPQVRIANSRAASYLSVDDRGSHRRGRRR